MRSKPAALMCRELKVSPSQGPWGTEHILESRDLVLSLSVIQPEPDFTFFL